MNKLEALKCVEVTSQRQANNGTVCYHDPQTNRDYILYENGYVRRSEPRKFSNQSGHTIYQLNPVRKAKNVFHRHDGSTYVYHSTQRVMLETHEERMELAARAVANYRKTAKKYEQARIEYAKRLVDQRSDRYMRMIMQDIQDSSNQYFEGNLSFNQAIKELEEAIADAKRVINV